MFASSAGNALSKEAFPDLGARGTSPSGIQTLNQQSEAFIDPDTAISRRKEDRSLPTVNQGGEAQINRQHGIPLGRFARPNELTPPAVEARDTGSAFLSKGTDTLRGNSEITQQLALGMKLLKSGEEGKPSFRDLHSL
jgi:hypothetical protein